MFGWFRKKLRDDTPQHDYDCDGIWWICPDCNNPHRVDETAEFRHLLEDLCTKIGESSNEIYEAFDLLSPDGTWQVQDEQALFKFPTARGQSCFARYGLVASWNGDTHSWMWAWGMPDGWVHPYAVEVADHAREVGEQKGWGALTSRLLLVDEHEAWHLTKLTAHLSDMPLVYRAKVNDVNYHYYAIERPVWAS